MKGVPALSVLRHTATALYVVADDLRGSHRDELRNRASMLTDMRDDLSALHDAAQAHLRFPDDVTARGLRDALARLRGEA